MKVRLISYSKPDRVIGVDDVQDLIAYCARVSNPDNQNNSDTAKKLIKYLIKHKHWSPLEMASACLEIETTRDIARQILRHRSFSFQEFSQRYADPTKDLDFVTREARLQDTKNRQNSVELDSESELHHAWNSKQNALIDAAKEAKQDQNFMVIARIEALISGAGMDEALKRATAYENAGADAILIHSKKN